MIGERNNIVVIIICSYISLILFLFFGFKFLEYQHSKNKSNELCKNLDENKDPKIRNLLRESCNSDKN